MKDISDGNYDSAITKSRTLVEEVFCYVIEKKVWSHQKAVTWGNFTIK